MDDRGALQADKMKNKNQKTELWEYAKKKYHLSPIHIQMAKELGLNPKKFGKLANHKQEPWKAPLPIFIEEIYFKRFKRDKPIQKEPKKSCNHSDSPNGVSP